MSCLSINCSTAPGQQTVHSRTVTFASCKIEVGFLPQVKGPLPVGYSSIHLGFDGDGNLWLGLAVTKKGLLQRDGGQSLFQVFNLPPGGTTCNLKSSFPNNPDADTAVLLSDDNVPVILAGDRLRIGNPDDTHSTIIDLPRPTHLSQPTYRVIQSPGRRVLAIIKYADSEDVIDYRLSSSLSLLRTCPVKRTLRNDLYLLNVADDETVTTIRDEWPYPLVGGSMCSDLSLLRELKQRPKHLVVANDTAVILSTQIRVYSQEQEQPLRIINFPDGVSASLFAQPIVSKDQTKVGVIVEKFSSSGIFAKSEKLRDRQLLIYETKTWTLVNSLILPISGFVEAAFAVDGNRLAVLKDDGVVFYDFKSSQLVK